MNNNKLISELLWIQESIICRMTTDATQSLQRLIQTLQLDTTADKKQLPERLHASLSALHEHGTLRAAALLATIIDQEMTAYIKWRARHTMPLVDKINTISPVHPALSRINNLLFDDIDHVEPIALMQKQELKISPDQENARRRFY